MEQISNILVGEKKSLILRNKFKATSDFSFFFVRKRALLPLSFLHVVIRYFVPQNL